ncbi:MAG: cupin-like domain-containing protein [Novosphingobium sp.]|nr:cupin-like domain-containing protein [Novosphingobium sp.]
MNNFTDESCEAFSRNYPEVPHSLVHTLDSHPLLTLESLAELADSLPMKDRECNVGDLPIGVDEVPEQFLDNLGERLLNIDNAGCWIALRHVEQNAAYNQLLHDLFADLKPAIESATGKMLQIEGYIFVTSPGGVAPFHMDPEHNILLQVKGSKLFTTFPAGDPRYAPDEQHEAYHVGRGRHELRWRDELADGAVEWHLGPGDALYVPVMAPHYVVNSQELSISISVVWRSEWSFEEADARAFNGLLRKAGISPSRPRRWPEQNRAKSLAWRALRKTGVVD